VLVGLVDFAVFVHPAHRHDVLVWVLSELGYGASAGIPFPFHADGIGTGLWLTSLNVKFRDVKFVVPFLTQVWMYASPIIYPSSLIPERWRTIYA